VHVPGESVATRNRVVLWALGVGALLAIATWQLVGPWAAMAVGIVAVLVASVAYRVERPNLPMGDDPADARPVAHDRPWDQ
jgi:hypothetical protein